MLDAYIPEGALSAEAEDRLLARLTDLLLQHEGVDPANQAATGTSSRPDKTGARPP